MRKDIKLMDIEDKDNKNVLPFEKPKLILATGTGGSDENWLANLEEGVIFLAREKSVANRNRQSPTGDYTLALELYMVQENQMDVAELIIKTPDNHQLSVWVSTLEFSRKKDLVKVLGNIKLKKEDLLEESILEDDKGSL